MQSKVCKSCGIEKQDKDFIKSDGQHRSTRNRCKDCHKKQSSIRKKLRQENIKNSYSEGKINHKDIDNR